MFIPREFTVNLPIHDDLPEAERPLFRFSASTWAERLQIIEAAEGWEAMTDERQVIDRVLPILKRHILQAPFAGELEQGLSYVELVQLFGRLRLFDQLSAMQKKSSE